MANSNRHAYVVPLVMEPHPDPETTRLSIVPGGFGSSAAISATRRHMNELIPLLLEARRLDNQTVRMTNEVAVWRRQVDKALEGAEGDDPAERYDFPARAEHRAFVDRLFFTRPK
jgi:hypothetical protein